MYSEKLSQRWVTTSHGVTKRRELDIVRFGRDYFVKAASLCTDPRHCNTESFFVSGMKERFSFREDLSPHFA